MLPQSKTPLGKLRILETTDLHMHLLAYNYFADRVDHGLGLMRMADVIRRLRADAQVPTLLCDNGDFLQGNPLADQVAATLQDDEIHPMIAAMNALEYDAVTLGNHEFDYGVSFLRRVLKDAQPAVVSANIAVSSGPPLAKAFTILERKVPCDDGVSRPLRIGLTGFGPPQLCRQDDAETVSVADIVGTAHQVVPSIKAAGADIVIALAHCGLGHVSHHEMMENAAVPLAAVDGIDALLLGHTHAQFPNVQGSQNAPIDQAAGTIHGKPAVMAGFYGQSLGVIDLTMAWRDDHWHIDGSHVRLVQPQTGARATHLGTPAIHTAHTRTLSQMRAPIAHTNVPVQSHFATVAPDMSMQLLACAMSAAVQTATGTTQSVLAAVSPFRFGGRNGLGQYIDIAPGPVTLRDAAAIFPFADSLCAVRRSGAQIRAWLERSASHYRQISPSIIRQPLIHAQSPHYNCDALYGMTYEIDLSQPARFDVHGTVVDPAATRLRNVRINGQPLQDNASYTVATNSFRARGGGNFAPIPADDMLWTSPAKLRDILIDALRTKATIDAPVTPVWSFRPITGAIAQFQANARTDLHLPDHITRHPDTTSEPATFDIRF